MRSHARNGERGVGGSETDTGDHLSAPEARRNKELMQKHMRAIR
jgi:hypothetical protein